MEKVLVVEDDKFFREVFSSLLEEEGYLVDVAATGHEALKKLAKEEYQVVVTDLMMSDISGLEILSRVKQLDPAIEVIMVTGHGNIETAIYALKNGARDYLIKPINHEEFKHAVALCMEQRRLLDENHELKSQIKIFQVSQNIANCLDLERIYSMVVDALAKEVGGSKGLGFFLGGDGTLDLKVCRGLSEALGNQLAEYLQSGCDWHKDGAESLVVLSNFIPKENNDADLGGIKDALLFFIRSRRLLQGVVAIFNPPRKSFPAEINYRNVNFLLDQSSLALENAIRYTTVKNLLNIDELTGLYNYRYLEIALEREIKRADRFGLDLSVIFLDIDHLKSVNDVHGHLVGSSILKEVGSLIKRSVREVDIIIRYGGDEYTVLLVETGTFGAAIVSERIRKAIEGHTFVINDSVKLRLTASLGYASYPDDSSSKVELLEMADQAMYYGKASGKNTVFHISSETFRQIAKSKESLS
ncbi:GGDEF domain-containing response regulator [Geobacter argillaceus]|uniref:diguanylate cyclase n=1 Tax=Geobacter argillaceus TaxID=345631 RepID=A0A562VPU0_9BACT|nr:diguanylate cyclase [Geobacter argillaceus]TWJ19888.1 response regulator receiver modulated diguanylate cyclase [Geobacter argillaceus]